MSKTSLFNYVRYGVLAIQMCLAIAYTAQAQTSNFEPQIIDISINEPRYIEIADYNADGLPDNI